VVAARYSLPPSLGRAGDIDGDGHADFWVETTTDLRLIRGSAARLTGALALDDVAASKFVAAQGDSLHIGAALGDLDGDGRSDFALYSLLQVPAPGPRGNAQHVFYGRAGGFPPLVSVGDADATLVAPDTDASVIAGGDIDGDGRGDLVVGVRSAADFNGALFVLPGRADRFGGTIELAGVASYVGAPHHARTARTRRAL